jgi:crossover junction endodeoxyribonuclease RusA
MTITLPFPDKRLSPNAKRRKHWRTYQPVANAARELGWALTLEAVSPDDRQAIAKSEGKIAMTITFVPPDRRRRDDDGMIGSFKHARDGIAKALGVDDSRFRPSYLFADPEAPGKVEIVL